MISFDPADPFPLLQEHEYSYEEAKAHAELVDEWLGFDFDSVEAQVLANSNYNPERAEHGFLTEYWRGLPIQILQTPYLEFRTVMAQLKPASGQIVVDLGSAYGRLAHVIGRHHPDIQFIGYEVVDERTQEALRRLDPFSYPNCELQTADLSSQDFILERGDVFFLYDFGSQRAIEKTLFDLQLVARKHPITVVGRGRGVRSLVEKSHPWLTDIVAPDHHPGYSIYRS